MLLSPLQRTVFHYSKFFEQVTKMRHLGTTELGGRTVHHHVFDNDTSRDMYSLYEFQDQDHFTIVSFHDSRPSIGRPA